MKITEIFKSIQGETSFAGFPAAFVRMSGCNLECSYCDTVYSRSGGEEMPAEEVARLLSGFGMPLVVVTGGEPLLQRDELAELLARLDGGNHTVLVETNGSLPVGWLPSGVVKVMDIKCPDSGMSEAVLWENIDCLGEKDQIKFVLSSRNDYNWAVGTVRERLGGVRGEILFSPAHGKVDLRDLARWMLEDKPRARLQVQLHRIIWAGESLKGR